ncbi:MAG: GNAT family N-acetyltransferase [Spirochaetales bacterium]|nr:GNAT family N-acetyltransferase [Leptospiraceae bacterium]MCP5482861.1 GNAT family N-acetyltransferase [Spirochaetales bacterium]
MLPNETTSRALQAAAALEQQCFANGWTSKQISDSVEYGHAQLLLSDDSGRIFGPYPDSITRPSDMISGYLLYSAQPGTPVVREVLRIGVAPEHRHRGHARALLEALFSLCDSHARVWLELSEANEAALGLYTRAGFQIVSRRPRYYGQSDALLMERLASGHEA